MESMSVTTTLSASERRSVGQRGWKVYWTLVRAEANEPLRDLIGCALRTKCYEAAAAALRLWDEMSPRTRARIEQQAKESRSPQSIARRIRSVGDLTDLIDQITEELLRRSPRCRKGAEALIEAYREEVSLRTAYPNRQQPSYDWASTLLTARDERHADHVERERERTYLDLLRADNLLPRKERTVAGKPKLWVVGPDERPKQMMWNAASESWG